MLFTRALIKRFAGALVPCTGIVACLLVPTSATAATKACKAPRKASHFFSAPRLHPARIHVCTRKKGAGKGMIFIGPFKDSLFKGSMVGAPGALMLDQGGHPVWFHPAPKGQQDSDFQTDQYGAASQPVISFWQGKIEIPRPNVTPFVPAGTPLKGAFYIYNDRYRRIKTIKALGKGWITDFHELILTKPTAQRPQGTAIFFAVKKKSKNLRKYGGIAHGAYEDQEIQQVDLATNKLVFHWDVNQHVPLSASRVRPPSPSNRPPFPTKGVWDPYHANSINLAPKGNSLAPAGDMLVSLRNTWGIYDIKPSGAIRWRLINGKGTNFKVSKNGRFRWQHDARFHSKNQISMFDDGCCQLGISFVGHRARGLVLSLSKSKKSATVVRQYHHPNVGYRHSRVPTAGSFQTLADGHAFIGWGQSYFYSEHSKKGMVYDAAMPQTDMSYRAVKAPWRGTPFYKPNAAARKAKSKITVYASWNGATTVASWKVFAGKTATTVTKLAGHAKNSGFETAIHVTNKGPYYRVQAFDSHGAPIPGGTSKPVKVS
jgi:hypothetical protein